jgi:PAS domain S-box-containing protein
MTEAVRMIVDGNLERTVDVRSRDEIGVLAEAFNTMTGRLRETLQGLRESEANYRGIVENALEGLYRSSFEGRLLTANPAMARILGYDSPDELISTVTDIRRHLYVQPEDCDAVISTIRQFGKVEAREVQFRRKDGTVIWVSIGGRLVRDDAGRPLFIEGFLYDISVRKRAELALEESERRLTSAIQGSPVPTFVIDRDHRVIYWNQALAELSGFAAAEMVGTDRHWRAFYEAERPCMADLLLDGALDAIPRLYAGKFQQSGLIENAFEATDYFPQHRGGAGAWLRFTAAAIRDASGRAVGAIEILEDITEAKRAADLIAGLGALRARLFAAGGGVEKLRLITDGVVTVFRADFARIWLTRAGDLCDRGCLHAAATDDIHRCRDRRRCLHLVVSSGRYIHLDGGHRRVPLGCYKIGRVAAGDEPLFLTNDVTSDPRVHDHEWARGLGLVSFAGFRLLSEDGKPIGVLALFSKRTIAPHEAKLLEDLADTTTRVILAAVAEEALKESEQRFRAIFDNTTDGILLADIGSKTFFLGNRRICEMLGYAPEEIRALGIADIHPQAALPHVMEQFERQARKEIAVAADLPVKRKDGTVFYADIGSSPVVLGGRTFMIGVFRDATERKLAEEALRQSEQRFKQVAENAGEWIWEVDAEGVYRYCSAAVETILGYSPAELVGQKHYYDLFAPEVRAELMAGARAAFQRKEAFVKFVNPNVHKSGAVVILETTGSPVLDDQGNLLGYRGVDADVTERQRAEAEIRRLNAELEQRVVERTRQLEIANQELEAFSYSVSHDLRAPLRSVDGFSQALLEDYADRLDPQGRDYLQRARLASQRMARLIDDLLKLSRVSRSEMRRGPVDLAALARAVVAELRAAEPERQVEFVCPPQLMANADESLLRVALENLLGNAWKFTGRHPAAKVEFGVALAKREDGQVVYYVRDDGAGFDMAHAAKLFGPFQRMHSSAEFRGSGIGLATVQRIVRRHGGEVWAKAAVEQGATFYFTLPA